MTIATRDFDRSYTDPMTAWLAGGLTVFAVIYNGIFAILNAHVFGISTGLAVLCEIAIVGAGLFVVLRKGPIGMDALPFAFLGINIAIGLVMSIGYDFIWPDFIRNALIISVFTMMGFRIDTRTVTTVFATVSLLVLGFLILEILSVRTYVQIFQPASFLASSRGVKISEFNDTGLFNNAMGFAGRFSFGLFSGPRTSSLFIEQVSLSGYAAVVAIFLSVMWREVGRWTRVMHIALVLLIVLSSNARTASMLMVVTAVGYFVFPRLPRYGTFLIAPMMVLIAFILGNPAGGVAPTGDNMIGRVSATAFDLYSTPTLAFWVGWPAKARNSFDSGYMYLIAATTLFGLIAFWAYANFICKGRSAAQRRCDWSVGIYIWAWLLIGGTAIFSMKTATLLWLVVGCTARQPLAEMLGTVRGPKRWVRSREQIPGGAALAKS